jgi:hypothetical protein
MKYVGCCLEYECLELAEYGVKGSRLFCYKHTDEYFKLNPPTKKQYSLFGDHSTLLRCTGIDMDMPDCWEDNPLCYRNVLRNKQLYVEQFINRHYYSLNSRFETKVEYNGKHRKADALILFHTHSIIIETDEKQHKKYNKKDENVRNDIIFNGLGGKPLVFIRFNPDGYKDNLGKKHKGCFEFAQGMLDQDAINYRLSFIKQIVDFYIYKIPADGITQCYLFYDGFAPNKLVLDSSLADVPSVPLTGGQEHKEPWPYYKGAYHRTKPMEVVIAEQKQLKRDARMNKYQTIHELYLKGAPMHDWQRSFYEYYLKYPEELHQYLMC